jgi:hypothetical protein
MLAVSLCRFLFALLFDPDNEGVTFFGKIG